MFVKQLSVFIENREGRLEQVTDVLKTQNINILSLSMADTTEYGMLRMVVSNPEVAKKALREEGFSAMLTDVLAAHLAGMRAYMLQPLVEQDLPHTLLLRNLERMMLGSRQPEPAPPACRQNMESRSQEGL